jgi:hypothetical protein
VERQTDKERKSFINKLAWWKMVGSTLSITISPLPARENLEMIF